MAKVNTDKNTVKKDFNNIFVGADLSKPNNNLYSQVFAYNNSDFTFRGELKNYNYNNILKDKQTHIYKLMELASYYVDSDDIVGGVVKRVLTPFSLSCGWKLKGTSEKTKQKYIEHYENSGFMDVARSIFYELYLFANCYIYFMDDGRLITLPPHRIRIADIMINGEPVIEFNVVELNRRTNYGAKEIFVDTLLKKYEGYPTEIKDAIKSGTAGAWIQLNPDNTFVLQEAKPMWQKYAIPFISTCLKPLSKKELISYYEDVQLNIGAKGFLHAKLGHDELLPTPNSEQLNATAKIFQDALNRFPLAVTSHFVDAKFISVDSKGLFDKSKYAEVNSHIMASGGISPLVVTGESSDGSSFAEANVSVETAAQRIIQNQQNFSEMMKKYNKKLALLWRIGDKRIPIFSFNEVNLMNSSQFKGEALQLWQQGCVSRQTLLNDYYNMDYEQEKERKQQEIKDGDNEIFITPTNPFTSPFQGNTPGNNEGGRPEKDIKDSKQDKNNSKSGANPKPSNPQGSGGAK
ncbi:MAG: hypothetical protein ACM3O3_12845 [Syntrophothermus sp.]